MVPWRTGGVRWGLPPLRSSRLRGWSPDRLSQRELRAVGIQGRPPREPGRRPRDGGPRTPGQPPDELYAVVASGPRGDVTRRLRTRATRVEVDLGPYQVVGAVHGTPASDPLGAVLRRAAWVPLTDVIVVYHLGEDPVKDAVATLVVNRNLASVSRRRDGERGPSLGGSPGAPARRARGARPHRHAPRRGSPGS